MLGFAFILQEACEAAEEDEMKNELFDIGIQVLYDACPVSQEQGL